MLAGDHGSHFPGVNEQRFAFLPLVFADEPEGYGNGHAVEEVGGQGDDAFHQIRLNDVFPDFPLAGRLGGQGAVGQHQPDFPVRGKVVDHVLDPGVVGVARGGGCRISSGHHPAAGPAPSWRG